MDNETTLITGEEALAQKCDYSAREMETVLREWNATSDPVKRAIVHDAAVLMRNASACLAPPEPTEEPES